MINPQESIVKPSLLQTIVDPILYNLKKVKTGNFSAVFASSETGPELLQDPLLPPVYFALRSNGARFFSTWKVGETLQTVTQNLVEDVQKACKGDIEQIDVMELGITHSYKEVDYVGRKTWRSGFLNSHRGIFGMEIRYKEALFFVSPSTMIEKNCDYKACLSSFFSSQGINPASINTNQISIRSFKMHHGLVPLKKERPQLITLFRGNRIVPQRLITQDSIRLLTRQLETYLVQSVQKNGRMVYMYKPSLAAENRKRNNMIRQWMASLALARTANRRNDPNLIKVAFNNITYNLKHFYRTEGRLGFILHWKKAKLGAAAIALLAIMECRHRNQFRSVEDGLFETLHHLWQKDGSFRTFLKPEDKNDFHNFYPGEALLAWAYQYREKPSKTFLDKFMKSVRYYQSWHIKNRNPAFIPWHTQAYYVVWKETGESTLADAVFEMNDWLLSIQQTDTAPFKDMSGRFYDPKRSFFGPPHASSTGVYLEGLTDAFSLAKSLKDHKRAEAYRKSIVAGLRSVMQLTFKNETDAYYCKEPRRVTGGVRTTVYNNEIRVDNVQHNLMALHKILGVFKTHDYLLESVVER